MSFPLAPMDGIIRASTYFTLALPLLFLGMAAMGLAYGPLFAAGLPLAAFFVAIYVFIWFWMRPSRFELDGDALVVVFPWRRIRIPLDDVTGARIVSRAEFRAEHGLAARIGAGGLWGGFGLLWTKPRMYMLYVSRVDRLLVVERREGRWLLITPARMDELRQALERHAQRQSPRRATT